MIRPTVISTLAVLFAIAAASPVFAHHSPPSLTEIEWNDESQRFEIAMRLSIPDLQDALSAKLNRRFRVEGTPDRDEHIRNYVRENFSVVFVGDKECRLRWVGVELQLHDVWVYFEAESVGGITTELAPKKTAADKWQRFLNPSGSVSGTRAVVVRNSCMLKLRPGQENVIQFRNGGQSTTKILTSKSPETTVR